MYTLVTGGAGFIGTHLIKSILHDAPHTLIVSLDDYSTGQESKHIEGVQYINGKTENALHILSRFKFDTIYHFAEYSRVHQSYLDTDKVQSSSMEGTSQIIRLAVRHDATLIYSATSSHLGQKIEDWSPHTWLKHNNVALIKKHQVWSKLKSHIFYFFNVYGPGQIEEGPHAGVIGRWTKQIQNNESLTVVEPGLQTRIYTRVESIARACTQHQLLPINLEWALYSDDKVNLIKMVQSLKKKTKWIEARDGDRQRVPKIKIPRPPHWEHPYRLDDWLGDLRRWTKPDTPEDYNIK